MKKMFTSIGVAACVLATVILATGCVTQGKQVMEKSTVFGFQAKTPGTSTGTSLLIQVGLVRNEYWSNPTSSNAVYAAPYNSAVHANLAPLNQTADENFGTYQLPTNAYVQPIVSTAISSIGTAASAATAVSTNK